MDAEDRTFALVSSAISDTYNVALKQAYEETLKARLVVWYTTMDERVCPVCGEMHGVEFDIRETEDLLPQHPQCRCIWVPVSEVE